MYKPALINFEKALFCRITPKICCMNLVINAFPVPMFGSERQAMLVVIYALVTVAPVHAVAVLLPLLGGRVTCMIQTSDTKWKGQRYG